MSAVLVTIITTIGSVFLVDLSVGLLPAVGAALIVAVATAATGATTVIVVGARTIYGCLRPQYGHGFLGS